MKSITLSDCLRDLIELLGQSELARQLGTTRQHVNRWAHGNSRPSGEYADKILSLYRKHMKQVG